jgi:hypothetical protein
MTQVTRRKQMSGFQIMAMALAGFVLVVSQSSTVHAQWATNGNNINNTNTGNVGIGTTTPTANVKLDVAGAVVINYSGDTVSSLLINATGNDGMPAFKVVMPATGLQKAFQLINTGNTSGWASFEYNVGATGKPGFALGSGSAVRDTKLYRDSASVLRTDSTMIVDGNFGIGTTNPVFDANVAKYLTVNGGSGVIGSIGAAGGTGSAGTAVGQVAFINSSLGTTDKRLATIVGSTDAATNSGVLDFYTASAGAFSIPRLRITSAGNIGIGTMSPGAGYKLDVQGGALNASGGLCIAGDCKTAWSQVGGGGSSQWTTTDSNIYYNSGNVGIGNTSPQSTVQIGAQTGSATASPLRLSLGGTYSNAAGTNFKLRLYDDGVAANVYGLGVSSGSMDFGVSPTAGYNWYSGGAHKMTLSSGGNVGIGTMNPVAALDVQNPLTAITAYGVRFQQTLTAGNNNAELNGLFINPNFIDGMAVGVRHNALVTGAGSVGIGTSATSAGLDIQNIGIAASGNTYGTRVQQVLPSAGNNGVSTAVYINPIFSDGQAIGVRHNGLVVAGGDVGIGTSTPSTKLHVVGDGTITGNLNVTGNINAKYQDIAEWVESSQDLAAGTVVVLDHTKSNQVIASLQAYDTRVAGVISSQPGIMLGENGAGKVLVATTGRVRIKVDASHGSIQVGDLLVTSDVAGLAMKSKPVDVAGVQLHRPGTLIGKALEPLAKGTGEILVLLSLQ